MNSKMIFMDLEIEWWDESFPNLYDLKIRSNWEELKDGTRMFSNAIPPLNNTDAMTLIRETMINGKPLMKEIYKYNKENVKEIFMNTDHSYSNKRILLSKIVAEYIESIYNDW